MKQLKVIQIIDQLEVGGAEVLAVNIANGFSEMGIDSHLCVTRKQGSLKKNISGDVGYIFLERKATFDIKAILRLKKYIVKHQIEVVHAHSSSSFIAFCLKMIYPQVHIIWHDHFGNSEFLKKRKKYPVKIFSFFFKSIISVNQQLKDWAISNLRCKNVFFINNFATFQDVTNQTILKGEPNKKIVHLAGFRPQKDHINLLKAFQNVLKKHPKWTLHLIGKEYQDAYSKSVNDFIKKNQLSDKVFLYGVCADIKYILSQATIGVLSSKSEGLPVSLLEYGLAQLPVLVTDVGECASVVKNKNALVVPNRSDKFAKQLENLIKNENLRQEISYDLHQSVLRDYTKDVVLNQLIKIYNTL